MKDHYKKRWFPLGCLFMLSLGVSSQVHASARYLLPLAKKVTLLSTLHSRHFATRLPKRFQVMDPTYCLGGALRSHIPSYQHYILQDYLERIAFAARFEDDPSTIGIAEAGENLMSYELKDFKMTFKKDHVGIWKNFHLFVRSMHRVFEGKAEDNLLLGKSIKGFGYFIATAVINIKKEEYLKELLNSHGNFPGSDITEAFCILVHLGGEDDIRKIAKLYPAMPMHSVDHLLSDVSRKLDMTPKPENLELLRSLL